MKDQLRFNICNLPSSYLPNSKVPDLAQQINKNTSPELSYSCRFWIVHLQRTQFNICLAEEVRAFFNQRGCCSQKTISTCISFLFFTDRLAQTSLLFDLIPTSSPDGGACNLNVLSRGASPPDSATFSTVAIRKGFSCFHWIIIILQFTRSLSTIECMCHARFDFCFPRSPKIWSLYFRFKFPRRCALLPFLIRT